MKFTARIPVTAALLALLLITATGCNRLKARDQLTKGVQAFKNARYEEAVNHFQNSIALDPDYEDAKLYLATAYSYQVSAESGYAGEPGRSHKRRWMVSMLSFKRIQTT